MVKKNNSCSVPGQLDRYYILSGMSEKFREAKKKQRQMGGFVLSRILGNLCVDEEESVIPEHYTVQRAPPVLRRRPCAWCGVCPQEA